MRNFPYRDYGPAVMYRPGKILYVGGGSPPTATTEAIDLHAAKPKWVTMAPMHFPRRHCNATVLPDGRVLVNGGTFSSVFDDPTEPVYQSEIWDPATNTWTLMAAQQIYRGYHSTAILLPDGRVFSSGGGYESNYEMFSPTYLFKGQRPAVTTSPAGTVGGLWFKVDCPQAATIANVSLIRLGTTTHTMNNDQRFQWLSFKANKASLDVRAPDISPDNPSGYYMLFVLNSQGVPSVGRIVRLGPSLGVVTKTTNQN